MGNPQSAEECVLPFKLLLHPAPVSPYEAPLVAPFEAPLVIGFQRHGGEWQTVGSRLHSANWSLFRVPAFARTAALLDILGVQYY